MQAGLGGKGARKLLDRLNEAALVEFGRMTDEGKGLKLVPEQLKRLAALGEHGAGFLGLRQAEPGQARLQAPQHTGGPAMQFPGNPATLVLMGAQELDPEPPL